MKEKINACYERLQTLNITPTRKNMETLLQVLYDLQEVYQSMKEDENGQTVDPT